MLEPSNINKQNLNKALRDAGFVDEDLNILKKLDFAFMNQLEPSSVMLAEGSEITVEPKQKMT